MNEEPNLDKRKSKKKCLVCGKEIPKLNYLKEPNYYFKQVRKDEADCLYWCSWDCIKKHLKNNKYIKIAIS